MMKHLRVLLTMALSCALLGGTAWQSAAAPVTGPDTPAGRAAAWLAVQAVDGQLPQPVGDSTDWGLTTDAILGLHAADADESLLSPFMEALEDAVTDRSYAFLDMPEHTDGGMLAKALLVVAQTGLDPRDFGGLDLVAEVTARITDGRLDRGSPGANVFSQSYGVLSLASAGEDARTAVRHLLLQQCPAGHFRLGLADEQCTSGEEVADRDATAIAVTALMAAGGADEAVGKARTWLVSDQGADGSWVSSAFLDVPNSNTTALAAQALTEHDELAVARAVGFTSALQLSDGPDAGAVAFDASALTAANGGEVTEQVFQWHRATAQALFALALLDPATTPGTHTVSGRLWETACNLTAVGGSCNSRVKVRVVRDGSDGFEFVDEWVPHRVTNFSAQ